MTDAQEAVALYIAELERALGKQQHVTLRFR